MISKLAERIAANKGKNKHRPTCICVHTTGSGIVEKARKRGLDPEAFAVDYYIGADAYPEYMIAHDGSTYAFANEENVTAHAGWQSWERDAYRNAGWMKLWLPLGEETPRAVGSEFYRAWADRWGAFEQDGLKTPREILAFSDGETPNKSSIGIELLGAKPFFPEQYTALARLCIDIAVRYGFSLLDGDTAISLPNPWLFGHEDVCPIRRWQKRKDGSGFGWDPGPALSWPELQRVLEREAKTYRDWRP